MSKPIQAKSLSSLNELAANPPSELSAQLRRKIKGELTLYIARVPGTRDVFLTTMKPRQKVVTSQDVDSSLYYFHVELPEDKAIEAAKSGTLFEMGDENNAPAPPERPQPPELGNENNEPVIQERLHPPSLPDRLSQLPSPPHSPDPQSDFLKIPRKPVSPDPEAHTDDYLVPQPLQPRPTPPRNSPSPDSVSRASAIRRKPIGHHQATNSLPAPFPHRPAGPRPVSKGDVLPIPVHTMYKENDPPPRYSGHIVPPLPLRNQSRSAEAPQVVPTPNPRRNSGEAPQATTFRHGAPPPLQLRRATDMSDASGRPASDSSGDSVVTSKGFSVNVIRRDPATGNQWNIGRFTKDGTALDSSADKVALEISSGGYAKFKDATEGSESDTDRNAPFKRNLRLRQRRKNASSSRRGSPSFRTPTELAAQGPEPANVDDAANTPFSFTSPWQGSCDFSTSVSGRTMRCRHYHSATGEATFSAGIDSKLALSNSSAVSELRFNLPLHRKSNKQQRDSSKKNLRPALSANASSSSRSSFDSRLSVGGWRYRLTRSIDGALGRGDDEEERGEQHSADEAAEERLDLSLGQESAGGGALGNKAKLGKLIIEGDGMLMLDLAVMANMGLWWSVASRFK